MFSAPTVWSICMIDFICHACTMANGKCLNTFCIKSPTDTDNDDFPLVPPQSFYTNELFQD